MEIDQQDILHHQAFITGIREFKHLGVKIIVTGGRRTDRNFWFRSFDRISCVFYFVNLCGYRRNLREDNKMNNLNEDIRMIELLSSKIYFEGSPFFLILSMVDLYHESLEKTPFLEDIHNDFNSSMMTPTEFLISKLNPNHRDLIVFETCGFDLERNDFLFDLVIKKLNGETLEKYYPYPIPMKLKLNPNFFDINFNFC
jgi:hypothetical protein